MLNALKWFWKHAWRIALLSVVLAALLWVGLLYLVTGSALSWLPLEARVMLGISSGQRVGQVTQTQGKQCVTIHFDNADYCFDRRKFYGFRAVYSDKAHPNTITTLEFNYVLPKDMQAKLQGTKIGVYLEPIAITDPKERVLSDYGLGRFKRRDKAEDIDFFEKLIKQQVVQNEGRLFDYTDFQEKNDHSKFKYMFAYVQKHEITARIDYNENNPYWGAFGQFYYHPLDETWTVNSFFGLKQKPEEGPYAYLDVAQNLSQAIKSSQTKQENH